MSFLYINPGYAALTDGPANGNTFSGIGATQNNTGYNPYNALSFGFIREVNDTSITLNTGTEYWIKYGIASGRANDFNYINIVDSSGNNIIKIYKTAVLLNGTNIASFPIQATYQDLEIHIKSDATNGMIEMWKDNATLLFSYSGNVFSGNNIKYLNFNNMTDFGNEYTYLSNIIIKDTGRIGSEKVAILSAASIDTDMTKDTNNNYKATVAGSHIYMAPDKAAFISSKNITVPLVKITGIMVGSTVGRYDSGNLNLVDAYIKNTSTNQENLIDEHSLVQSSSKKGVHANGLFKNPFTNQDWQLNDLDTIEMGFKSKSST
jgi:hypothetical protein